MENAKNFLSGEIIHNEFGVCAPIDISKIKSADDVESIFKMLEAEANKK